MFQSMILTLIAFSLYALNAIADTEEGMPAGWRNCGSPADIFQLKSLEVQPDPPKRGKELIVSVKGALSKPLDGGHIEYEVSLGAIPLVKDKLPLCEALKLEPGLPQCELRAGDWEVSHRTELPIQIPFGTYRIAAQGFDLDGKRIFCVTGSTTIKLLSSIEGERLWQSPDEVEDAWMRQVVLS